MEIAELFAGCTLWIAGALAAAAGFMRGFVGVGSGMLMAPVFAILFGPLEAVGMIILLDSVATFQLLPSVARLIEWRAIVPMGVAAAAFMPLGTWLLVTLDPGLMARAIAFTVLICALVLMSGWRYRSPKRLAAGLGVGSLSGVLIAATSLGNPPVMLYFLSGADPAATTRANFTGYFALTLATLLAMMALRGLIAQPALLRAGVLLPIYLAGTWGGARCFHGATDRLYRQVALWLLIGVGVYGVLR
jgi:hypothetical protein